MFTNEEERLIRAVMRAVRDHWKPSEHVARALGFAGPHEVLEFASSVLWSSSLRPEVLRLQYAQFVGILEIVPTSTILGVQEDWTAISGYDDEATFEMVQVIRAKMDGDFEGPFVS